MNMPCRADAIQRGAVKLTMPSGGLAREICDLYGPADDVKEPLSTTCLGVDAVIYPYMDSS